MTREEAIEYLKRADTTMGKKIKTRTAEALDMAIKALEQDLTYYPPCIDCYRKMDEIRRTYDNLKEQEPCEDCISRKAVLEGINRYIEKAQSTGTIDDFISFEELVVKALPPVTPQHTTEEIQKMQGLEQAEIQKAYELGEEDKIKVLDKIREEIDIARFIDKDTKLCKNANASGLEVAMQIIDKYKAERR